jgi:phosphoenolpyruvate synthase/pyruvate phosphate dikinase
LAGLVTCAAGICITATAYQDFLKATNLDRIETILAEIDMDDRVDIEIKSGRIRPHRRTTCSPSIAECSSPAIA